MQLWNSAPRGRRTLSLFVVIMKSFQLIRELWAIFSGWNQNIFSSTKPISGQMDAAGRSSFHIWVPQQTANWADLVLVHLDQQTARPPPRQHLTHCEEMPRAQRLCPIGRWIELISRRIKALSLWLAAAVESVFLSKNRAKRWGQKIKATFLSLLPFLPFITPPPSRYPPPLYIFLLTAPLSPCASKQSVSVFQ